MYRDGTGTTNESKAKHQLMSARGVTARTAKLLISHHCTRSYATATGNTEKDTWLPYLNYMGVAYKYKHWSAVPCAMPIEWKYVRMEGW